MINNNKLQIGAKRLTDIRRGIYASRTKNAVRQIIEKRKYKQTERKETNSSIPQQFFRKQETFYANTVKDMCN